MIKELKESEKQESLNSIQEEDSESQNSHDRIEQKLKQVILEKMMTLKKSPKGNKRIIKRYSKRVIKLNLNNLICEKRKSETKEAESPT